MPRMKHIAHLATVSGAVRAQVVRAIVPANRRTAGHQTVMNRIQDQ
ncbi:hypothetical protein C8J33_10436 [Rhizobium sp. PP-CC-3G-465]|nr:hypothetical protein C8J31_106242 [Rhizobium sp. PP-CC-2G-626]TCQ23456.1 hypothetical protein C8J33_10436 [Rhizobium sp. PP-CC-3G-465]